MNYNPPGSLSSKGWRLFDKEFKEEAPIRYWIKEDFKHAIIYPIKWKYRAISDWIRYRTYDRCHVVKTGLKPGYCDITTQMLNVSFNMLKDFVECELAWSRFQWESTLPWYRKIRIVRRYIRATFRDPKLGLEHLDWAATLDDPRLPPKDRCDHQAISARETRELYIWWVNTRPARKEIEIPKYKDQGLGILSPLDEDFDRNSPDFKKFEEAMKTQRDLDEEWKIEDTEMLVRLVKVREGLWT